MHTPGLVRNAQKRISACFVVCLLVALPSVWAAVVYANLAFLFISLACLVACFFWSLNSILKVDDRSVRGAILAQLVASQLFVTVLCVILFGYLGACVALMWWACPFLP